MGRSVNYLTNATEVWYMHQSFDDSHDWDDFKTNLQDSLMDTFGSLTDCDRWDGRETHIFLQNSLVELGLSEYCGVVSLSVRPREDRDPWTEAFAHKWVDNCSPKIEAIVKDFGGMVRLGGFSNGESVYKKY